MNFFSFLDRFFLLFCVSFHRFSNFRTLTSPISLNFLLICSTRFTSVNLFLFFSVCFVAPEGTFWNMWSEWVASYGSVFAAWTLFSALHTIHQVASWDFVVFGRLCRNGEHEIAEPMPLWRNLFQILNDSVSYGVEKDSECNDSSAARLHSFILSACRIICLGGFQWLFGVCEAIRRNTHRRRQVLLRIGAFAGGEPFP